MKKANHFLFYISYSLFLISLSSCSVNKAHIDNELKSFYDDEKAEGCFTMLDNATGQITVYNMGLDTTRFAPGATFDIVNNLIGLQTGVIPDANAAYVMNQSTNDSTVVADSINMIEAFNNNDDAFTRFLTNKTGKEILTLWIDSLSYGNKNIKSTIDSCWLNNTLKISPDEQLGLLKRLYFDQLPFMKSVQESLRNMMVKEDNTLYKLSYKNASSFDEKGNTLNWTIGWIEENRHVYFFVNLIQKSGKDTDIEKTGVRISKDILAHYGFLKGVK